MISKNLTSNESEEFFRLGLAIVNHFTSMVGTETVRIRVGSVGLPTNHGKFVFKGTPQLVLPPAQDGKEGPEGHSPEAHHRSRPNLGDLGTKGD